MQLEILTPTFKILQKDLVSATLPGINGKFTVLKNHSKLCASLKDELVNVTKEDNTQSSFLVRRALAFISSNKIMVVAEYSLELNDKSLSEEKVTNLFFECSKNLSSQNKDPIFKEYWSMRLRECEILKNHVREKSM